MIGRRFATLALLMMLAWPVSAARAGSYSQVLHAYQIHGSVPPCQFSSQQLDAALKGIDTYGAQYFQDFTSAIQSALAARASGVCAAARPPTAPSVTGHAVSSPPPLALGPTDAATNSSLPAPIVMTAILAAALALLGAGVALTRWSAWSPRWAAGWRHMWSEAGYRAEGTWLEFSDWLRSGRH